MRKQNSTVRFKTIVQILSYVEAGNVTTTTLALICLHEVLIYDTPCSQALIDGKAVKLLLNVLETNLLCTRRSQFTALRCLRRLCECRALQKELINSRGINLLFHYLNDKDYELMLETLCIISDISSDLTCAEAARSCGGIHRLVCLLNASQSKFTIAFQGRKNELVQLKLEIAQNAAKSLSALCNNDDNRKIACSSNILEACQFWIRSKHQRVTIPILVLLQTLSVMVSFRKQVIGSNMLQDVLHHLHSTDMEMKQAASDLIFICAEDQEAFKPFHKQEFLAEFFQILSNKSHHKNEALMTLISGIIWKCSKTHIYIKQLETLGVMPVFIQLLENQPVQIKTYIVGTIGMCFSSTALRDMIKKTNVIDIIVNFLQTTYVPLIININETLAKGSEDEGILVQYIHLNAVQLVWSCLKNSDIHVQSSAASSLCTILKNMKKANMQMENSLDGIECIIDLLTSNCKKLLIPACTLIHHLAQDKGALSVLVEFDVASHLMKLMKTHDKKLLQQLCLAAASCCSLRKGCEKFAECGISCPLLKFLNAKDKMLRALAASALSELVSLPGWCPPNQQNRIVPEVKGEEMVLLARTGFASQQNHRKKDFNHEQVKQNDPVTASALVSLENSGSRLANSIIKALSLPDLKVTFWSDSTTALWWITEQGNWSVFVENRVKEIRELTRGHSWRHVPGKLNIADLLSRGCFAKQMLRSRWWEGPLWLREGPENWPT
ncbi:armadillo repeat-containing protein gudu-like, partial [Stegodyphus dumicola]|uniref:armadillo repeat-containing protein gudu-like n=1 Tax=Stegodyphus dumicola TaxID=202533 RepID=UPI0015A76BB2